MYTKILAINLFEKLGEARRNGANPVIPILSLNASRNLVEGIVVNSSSDQQGPDEYSVEKNLALMQTVQRRLSLPVVMQFMNLTIIPQAVRDANPTVGINETTDFSQLNPIDWRRDPKLTQVINLMNAAHESSDVPVIAMGVGANTLLSILVGHENYCCLPFQVGQPDTPTNEFEEDPYFKGRIDYAIATLSHWHEALKYSSVAGVVIAEPTLSTNFTSPNMVNTFGPLFLNPVFQNLRNLNMLSVLHICGSIQKILNPMAGARANGYSMEEENMIGAAKVLPGIMFGNQNPSELARETPALIRSTAEKWSRSVAPLTAEGRVVPSTGCQVTGSPSEAQFEAWIDGSRPAL
jgi:uroporphyrinogen-III decarboxylase